MKKKNKLSSEDKRKLFKQEHIKLWQSICRHDGAFLSNTGTSGSKCALCGKEMYPPNPSMNV